MEAAREAAEHEISWGRVWLVVAILFFWAPLFGLVLSVLAFLTNRQSPGWKRTTSIVLLVVSVLLHVALATILIVG